MKIRSQDAIYTTNEEGHFLISFCPATVRTEGFINFTGLVYSDRKYHVFLSMIGGFGDSLPIVTDQDLVAHDSYIEKLNKQRPIIFVVNEGPSARSGFDINDKTVYGCSENRINRAVEKLHEEGFTCVHIAKSIKGAEKLIDQARRGTIRHRATNVINVKFGA